MKKIIVSIALMSLTLIPFLSSAAPTVTLYINRSGGFLGHYDNISSYTLPLVGGGWATTLNCKNPGWSRCNLANANSDDVIINGVDVNEDVLEQIYGVVDNVISSNSNNPCQGNFTTDNDLLSVIWTFDGTTSAITISANNQN